MSVIATLLGAACAEGTEGPGAASSSRASAGAGEGGGGPGTGGAGDGGGASGGAPSSSTDASTSAATSTGSASTTTGSTSSTSATSTSSATGSTGAGSGLDPELELPDPGGTTCRQIGSGAECPDIEVCRIASESGGICESCEPCGNLNASCTASDQCDILFQCFQGHCQNLCPLGTTYCGAPEDCIDVGHDEYGVCAPF